MDRSFAARSPAGRRQSPRVTAPGALAGAGRAIAGRSREALGGALGLIGARRRLRIAAICALVALPVLGGGFLLLRHSSLVAVEHVRISGAHGPEAHAIESALREAAKGMSTLDAQPGALSAAVARFPAVSAVREQTSFPHGMRIEVTQLPAVGALLVGGTRTAVAANGVVLGPSLLSSSLPAVADDVAPGTGSRLTNPLVLDALVVLGAAPPALDHLASRVYFGPRGLTVAMRNGLLVYFGDATRPHAKWLSLATVLADKLSAGATYVDVRLPGRPAAGFPPGAGPAQPEEATGESHQGSSESTVSALAAGLAAANPETKRKQEEESEGAAAKSEGESESHEPGSSEAKSGEGAGTEASAETGETGG